MCEGTVLSGEEGVDRAGEALCSGGVAGGTPSLRDVGLGPGGSEAPDVVRFVPVA